MIPRLKRLGGFVEGAASVAGIHAGAVLKNVSVAPLGAPNPTSASRTVRHGDSAGRSPDKRNRWIVFRSVAARLFIGGLIPCRAQYSPDIH